MTEATLGLQLEDHRRDLTAHCRRMLGSSFDAEDAVQETLVRAWRAFDRFEGRAALRSWLHRIATNVCVDMLRWRQRQPLPMDPTASGPVGSAAAGPLPATGATGAIGATGATWGRPSRDGRGTATVRGPEEVAVDREEVRQAFVALLQLLPPRQRAVLVLHDVLRWTAAEVAELLGTTVAAVNSALQRARATVGAGGGAVASDARLADPAHGDLLARYVDAFQRADVQSLVGLATTGLGAAPRRPGRAEPTIAGSARPERLASTAPVARTG
jgi:RNA polymerase sigma-70 factor (ECF subfamily)